MNNLIYCWVVGFISSWGEGRGAVFEATGRPLRRIVWNFNNVNIYYEMSNEGLVSKVNRNKLCYLWFYFNTQGVLCTLLCSHSDTHTHTLIVCEQKNIQLVFDGYREKRNCLFAKGGGGLFLEYVSKTRMRNLMLASYLEFVKI